MSGDSIVRDNKTKCPCCGRTTMRRGRSIHDPGPHGYNFGCDEPECGWRLGFRNVGRTLERVWLLLNAKQPTPSNEMLAAAEVIIRDELERKIAELEAARAECEGSAYERMYVRYIAKYRTLLDRRLARTTEKEAGCRG